MLRVLRRLLLPIVPLTPLALVATSASAEEPNFHLAAGGAHAAGGSQSSEFGAGGAGGLTAELPIASRVGLQLGAGAIVLGKGTPTSDPTLAPTSTGAAVLGTVGVRVRGFGRDRVAGPWIDANVGGAHTGDLVRPAVEAHIGWDWRVSHDSRIDVGPYLGYTQIVQPNSDLRSDDARILTAGFAISLGARERRMIPPPPAAEKPLPPPPPPPEPMVEAPPPPPTCPDGEPEGEDGCPAEVRLFENRIVLDDVIHFDFDSARIGEDRRSQRAVRNVARFINAHADIVDISIEGHADEIGTDEYNQRLSEQRAISMRELLVRNGVDRSRLRVVAHGKSKPKVVTTRAEFQNRRVEMYVTQVHEEHEPRVAADGHERSAK